MGNGAAFQLVADLFTSRNTSQMNNHQRWRWWSVAFSPHYHIWHWSWNARQRSVSRSWKDQSQMWRSNWTFHRQSSINIRFSFVKFCQNFVNYCQLQSNLGFLVLWLFFAGSILICEARSSGFPYEYKLDICCSSAIMFTNGHYWVPSTLVGGSLV